MDTIPAVIGPILFIINNLLYLNMGIYSKGVLITDRKFISA
jgi:hypothetical protein